MEIWVIGVSVAVLGVFGWYARRAWRGWVGWPKEVGPVEARMEEDARVDYRGCITKEQRRAAIQGARSAGDARDMLAQWCEDGLSPEGLLYAEGLERISHLGSPLTMADRARVERAKAAREHGRNLPRIHGRMRS